MSRVVAVIAVALLIAGANAYDVVDFGLAWNGYGTGTLNPPDGFAVEGPGGPAFEYSEGYFSGIAPTTGLLTFDYEYVCDDTYDGAFYRVNGTLTDIETNDGMFTGSLSIPLTAGDTFDIGAWSGDSLYGVAYLTVTNFNQAPEPSALTLLTLAGLTLLRRR